MKQVFAVISDTDSDVYDSTERWLEAIFETLDAAKKYVENNGDHGLFHGSTYSIRGLYLNNEGPANYYSNIEYEPIENRWI